MLLREKSFPPADLENVSSTISNSDAFYFKSEDITKLRKNMKLLIKRLADHYKELKPVPSVDNQSLSSLLSTDSNEKEGKESTTPKYSCTAGLRNLGISM